MSAIADVAPSRRERRRLEVRERILDAARGLFETKGYDAATVEEIARDADIAYGTFFNHFPAKLDLLRELSHVMLLELFEDVEEEREAHPSFADRLTWIFETAAARTIEKGPRARELLRSMMTLSFPDTAQADDTQIRSIFRRMLADGRATGEVRGDEDIETLTEVFAGTWYSMFSAWIHADDYPLQARAAATASFLARAFAPPDAAS